MTDLLRLAFVVDTVEREAHHLQTTDRRLFERPFDANRAAALRDDIDDAERTDAFVVRFGRLQDTLADKLLPIFLRCLLEPVGPALDNLDRAEKLGLLSSVDDWVSTRSLRNRMVHEYVRDPADLALALNRGHAMVPLLVGFEQALSTECRRRGWLSTPE